MKFLTDVPPSLHSDKVTHVVSENSQASSLWQWLKEVVPRNLPHVNVLDISWFTDSMRERRPVAVEARHLIEVCACHETHRHMSSVLGWGVSTRWHSEPNKKPKKGVTCASIISGNCHTHVVTPLQAYLCVALPASVMSSQWQEALTETFNPLCLCS